MWRTRLEVTALLEKSERIRKTAAELHGQLQALIASVERFLDTNGSAEETPYTGSDGLPSQFGSLR
jgi:hypothetical protein